ncbi:D-alanyl-D-alanine carboxypeptidase family protein [Pseudarthrobacter oxydans]|uniref:M15 family metallopeptidase n=1 Tax=Pseudarthrobacter oxydans TaxID=1671 RepID=UPI0037F8F526
MEPTSRTWLPSRAAVTALAFLALVGPELSAGNVQPDPGTPPTSGAIPLTDQAGPLVLVNKQHPLEPLGYVPADLRRPAVRLAAPGGDEVLNSMTAAAAEAMFAAAEADGVTITLVSGYRSYATQAQVRDGYITALGLPAAEAVSAPPGHSEHQTGSAMDIGDGSGGCSLAGCFADQPAAVWAATNAHRFGFIVRYPDGAQAITGYDYEPWHLRFVGIEAATDIFSRGITLEEFLGGMHP